MENVLPGDVTGAAAARDGARLDLDSAAVAHFIHLLQQKRIVIAPTMNVFEGLYATRQAGYYHVMKAMLKRLYDADVPLVIGTDAPTKPGSSLHHEMEIWAAVGIPSLEHFADRDDSGGACDAHRRRHRFDSGRQEGRYAVGRWRSDAGHRQHPQRPGRHQRWRSLLDRAVAGRFHQYATPNTASRNKT